jgi:hypothetical protein
VWINRRSGTIAVALDFLARLDHVHDVGFPEQGETEHRVALAGRREAAARGVGDADRLAQRGLRLRRGEVPEGERGVGVRGRVGEIDPRTRGTV